MAPIDPAVLVQTRLDLHAVAEHVLMADLREIREALGIEAPTPTDLYPLATNADAGRALRVDREAADLVATVFAATDTALGTLQAEAAAEREGGDAGLPTAQLWPEHFDLAVTHRRGQLRRLTRRRGARGALPLRGTPCPAAARRHALERALRLQPPRPPAADRDRGPGVLPRRTGGPLPLTGQPRAAPTSTQRVAS